MQNCIAQLSKCSNELSIIEKKPAGFLTLLQQQQERASLFESFEIAAQKLIVGGCRRRRALSERGDR